MVTLFKQLFTAFYGKKTYKHSVSLRKMNVKANILKDQVIFLEKCIKNNRLPKYFYLNSPIKFTNSYNIMKNCSKLNIPAKNNTK